MAVSIRFKFNQAEFARMTESGSIAQATWRAAGKVRDDSKRIITAEGLVNTGKLRASIVARRVRNGRKGVFYEIGSPLKYAIYQHEGTQGPIYPRRAKVLRFKPGGSGTFIFRPKVKGVDAKRFLTRALERLTANDFQA